jgi:putative ATP-dependent endonuclease of OLD family
MFISKLCMRNYRNFRNARLKFKKGVNTILGENGTGKTNIMYAIRLMLDESLPRNIRFFETDFNRSAGSWKGHWIIIQMFFDELDHGDDIQALALHHAGHAAPDPTKGSCMAMFRPSYDVRKKLFDFSQSVDKTKEKFAELLATITLNDYEPVVFRSRTTVDFSDDTIYNQYVGNWLTMTFPDPGTEPADIFGPRLYIQNLSSEVSCTYVKALRDVEADLKSYRDNPLINLLRGKEKTIEISKKKDIENEIKSLNKKISDLDEVLDISHGIGKSIRDSVGQTYAPGISIRSELPEDMEHLMQSLKLWVGDAMDENYMGRIHELSLGGANLIYLSTKLLEYERVKSKNKVANFLLIEEPEAHIHTHIQKTLFDRLPALKTQVIITTHSTHISSACKISAMNVLSKDANKVEVFDPSNGLSNPDISRIERYLDAVRSTLLFAKGVTLVEGDAEQILIPALVRTVLGVSLDEIGISLVNIGSTGFTNIATVFHQDRIYKYCAIITDRDESIIALPADPATDDAFTKDCRNSQISGQEREKKLKDFLKSNDCIDAFSAHNTFEVQFLQADNIDVLKRFVNVHYTRPADRTTAIKKLEDTDVAVYGREVLRLANSIGKGWFALQLAEHLDSNSNIPGYIIDALAWAMPKITATFAKALAIKRIDLLLAQPPAGSSMDYASVKGAIEHAKDLAMVMKTIEDKMPDDIINVLLKAQHGLLSK